MFHVNPIKFVDPSGHIFGIAAAIISYIAANAATIIASAAINNGIAAAQGGNVWKAALSGAIAGGFGTIGIIEGIAGGALGALVTGGDPGLAAATAGVGAGISIACGFTPLPDLVGGLPDISIGDVCLRNLAASAGVGALAGGVSSVAFGGDFGEGAMWGAAGAAAGYAVAVQLESFFAESGGSSSTQTSDATSLYHMDLLIHLVRLPLLFIDPATTLFIFQSLFRNVFHRDQMIRYCSSRYFHS